MGTEFHLDKPAIFRRPDLKWFRYAETRRDGTSPLAGNTQDDPRVLSQANFELVKPGVSFEEWVDIEKQATDGRLIALNSLLGVSRIGRVRPAHGTEFINLDLAMDQTDSGVAVTDRPFVDATMLSEPGLASMVSPADCIVATVVYPSDRIVAQIHAGIRGLPRHIIPQVIERLENAGASPEEALVYIAPHARRGFQMNAAEEAEVDAIASDAGKTVENEVARFTRRGEEGLPIMDLTDYAVEQLRSSGISAGHIQVSDQDTFTDPSLFSDLKQVEKGANGRFGVIAGIAGKNITDR